MAAVEREHWWYCGLRDLIARSLRRWMPAGAHPLAALDAGCGTGENLRLLQDVLDPHYLAGFDNSPLALEYAVRKAPQADIYLSDICRPELHVDSLDVITSCDVIYIPGAEAAFAGLSQLVGALRPGGLFILNVPAFNWLKSRHDAAVHTRQRFRAVEIRRLFDRLGLRTELTTYRLWSLFPAIVLARLPSIIRPPTDRATARSDVTLPPRSVNSFLRRVLCAENAAVSAGLRLPWGSSVFAVGRKP